MTIRQSVEPSAELRGLYIELTDFLGRLEALREEIQDMIERLLDEVGPPPRLTLIQGGEAPLP